MKIILSPNQFSENLIPHTYLFSVLFFCCERMRFEYDFEHCVKDLATMRFMYHIYLSKLKDKVTPVAIGEAADPNTGFYKLVIEDVMEKTCELLESDETIDLPTLLVSIESYSKWFSKNFIDLASELMEPGEVSDIIFQTTVGSFGELTPALAREDLLKVLRD